MNKKIDDIARIEGILLDDLKVEKLNPKNHDIEEIKNSIRRFGFTAPLLRNEKTGRLVAGHGRRQALLELREAGEEVPRGIGEGWRVPVVVGLSFKNRHEAKAYLLADNKISELGGWDDQYLFDFLKEINDETGSFDGIGFDQQDFSDLTPKAKLVEGDLPDPKIETVCKEGDVWHLGDHRLICGSCVVLAGYMKQHDVLGHLLVTDPPYGVNYENAQKHRENIKGKKRNIGSIKDDDKTPEEMLELWTGWFGSIVLCLKKGAVCYVFGPGSAQLFSRLITSLEAVGFYVPQMLAWVKNSHIFGRSDYHGKHENIAYGWKRGAAHHAVLDRTQSTVWEYGRPLKNDLHPTMKPPEMLQRMLCNSSNVGQIVVDGFGGSGSTLIAAELEKRICYMTEVSEVYCDVIIARWENLTEKKATKESA